jgi:hypothetical protein
MGIEFARSYKASDGKCYATIKEAQEVEIQKLLGESASEVECDTVAHVIVENAEAVMAILTINDSSRPRARGVKKPRKKAPASPAYSDIARLEEVASQVQTEAQRVLEAK